MKRPRLRLLVALIGALTVALVGSTSAAAYRTAMGPAQCCRTHCRHSHQASGRDAERCCRTHLTVLPATLTKVSSQDATAPAHVLGFPVAARALTATVSAHRPAIVEVRGPPLRALFTQHTSLLR